MIKKGKNKISIFKKKPLLKCMYSFKMYIENTILADIYTFIYLSIRMEAGSR